MNVTLSPMSDDVFATFVARSVDDFATEVAESASMPTQAARSRAEQQLAELLPEGGRTPGHAFFVVLDGERSVGQLWLGPHPQRPHSAFVYDILIDESERGRGFGRGAMVAAEEWARGAGLTAIGLSVFGSNAGARRLYESLGYGVVATSMLKELPA